MELGHLVSQEQKHILSQQQVEALSVLSMDMRELQEFLLKEQEENPLVTFADGNPIRTIRYDKDEDDKIQNIPYVKEERASDILLPQLNLDRYTPDEVQAFQSIAAAVNDDGFLRIPLEELSEESGLPVALFQKGLAVMQTLEPAGVCSVSLSECLLRQLTAIGSGDTVLHEIVSHYLTEVAEGKIGFIAQSLGITSGCVRQCIQVIRSLNPRPLNGLTGEAVKCVVPDLILSYKDNEWEVELNDSWIGRLEICDYYAALVRRTDDTELQEYLKNKMQRMRFLNDAVERRRSTLLRIGWGLVRHQGDFLLGRSPIAALTMTELAEELELHLSTLSRAVNGKYLQYPSGAREIRSLFTSGISGSDRTGSTICTSRNEIKRRLSDLISSEDKAHPYSDSRLTELFREQRIDISRRTVAKYREELGIKGMHDRRYF